MQKKLRTFAIFSAIALFVYVLLRLVGVIVPFKIPTTANEPNLPLNSYIWSSKFKKPKLFDFVCYQMFNKISNAEGVFVYRLCGMPGDRIAIRDGVLSINDMNADAHLKLTFCYKVTANKAYVLKEDHIISEYDAYNIGNDSAFVFLSAAQMSEAGLVRLKKDILPTSEPNIEIQKEFKNDWNADQFGPIVVPEGHYFLLGDNRRNAADSRYLGFIPIDKVIGTVLF